MIVYQSEINTIHRADAREVAAAEEAGSFSLAVFDGPYGMNKAEWDRMKVADLPEWYAPFFDDADRLLGADASLYVWNMAEGIKALHPLIVSMGWRWRCDILWDKAAPPSAFGAAQMTTWQDATETCSHYTRGDAPFLAEWGGVNVWRYSSKALALERLQSGRIVPRKGGGLNAESLHPCEKPVPFASRILRASSRPGDRVWVPFGGTAREAVANQRITREDPTQARHVVTCEIDQDGRDYLGAVVRQLRGEGTQRVDPRQALLFGAS